VVIARVAESGPRAYAWLLVHALRDLLLTRRPTADYLRMTRIALRAAELEHDLLGQASMQASLGRAKWRAGDLPGALASFSEAGRLAVEARWPGGEAQAAQGIGVVLKQQGQLEEAQAHYHRAAVLYRQLNDERGEAGCLNNVGSAQIALGHLREADEALRRALPLARHADLHLRSLVLVNLGLVSRERARFATALSLLEEALQVAEEAGSGYACAVILETVGHVHSDTGRGELAAAAFTETIALAERAEHNSVMAASLVGTAALATAAGRTDDAAEHLATAFRLIPRLGAESVPLVLIGEAAMRVKDGRPREALSWIERAADLAIASSPLDVPRVRLLESQAHGAMGETAPALAAAHEQSGWPAHQGSVWCGRGR
jgi:tetratricopeptide (TPR) repeat protein